MAREQSLLDLTFAAGADFSAKQHLACKLSAADTVAITSGATDRVLGVVQNNPPSGSAAHVRILGVTKWISDGSGTAIVVGDTVGTNNAGKCVKKATDADLVAGIALSASSADGTVIDVLLMPHQRAS